MRDRALEKVKAAVFIGSNAAFLGCLMCGINFSWDSNIETAEVTETSFKWNPEWFDSLMFDERKGVLLHELWHLALLHGARCGDRDHTKWNVACDIRINNNLIREGITLPAGVLVYPEYDSDEWTEEKIYADLPDNPQTQTWGTSHVEDSSQIVGLVQAAVTTANLAGANTDNIQKVITNVLKPILPWKVLLHKYLLEKFEKDYSFSRPNRRFTSVYLPSLRADSGKIVNIAMYLDTSGSISNAEIQRFISEVKFVKDNLNPDELRVVQFDTEIKKESIYNESDSLGSFNIVGCGGTDLTCVREHILEHKPALSIIFSDLYVDPMEPVGKLDVLWVCSSDRNGPFGETIHV